MPRKVIISLAGRNCMPDGPEAPIRRYLKEYNTVIELRALSQLGIELSVLPQHIAEGMLLKCYIANVLRGDPLIDASYGRYGTDRLPALNASAVNFWQSVPGLLEANRRAVEFYSKESRLPTRAEMEKDLGLDGFLVVHGSGLSDANLYSLLGHAAEYAAAKRPRKAGKRGAAVTPGEDAKKAPTSMPSRAQRRAEAAAGCVSSSAAAGRVPGAAAREVQQDNLPTRASQPAMQLQAARPTEWGRHILSRYGRELRAPVRFWHSAEAKDEARRRIDEFVSVERRLPSQSEVEIRLGLLGLTNAIDPDADLLEVLGYRGLELKGLLHTA